MLDETIIIMPARQIVRSSAKNRLPHYNGFGAILRLTVLLLACLLPVHALSQPAEDGPRLREDAPLKYTVKKGDTLWDISAYFLKDPWYWPELWYANPDIKNPHLIYPGEVLYLVYVDGRPRLQRTPGLGDYGDETEILKPSVRELPADQAIPTIPADAIRAFLKGPRIVGKEELATAPYIVEFSGEHLIGGAGMYAYALGLTPEHGLTQTLVRQGQIYRDPETDEILGYEAIYLGESDTVDQGKVSTVKLVTTEREVLKGDHLLEASENFYEANFYPRAPEQDVRGVIISVYDGLTQTGQYEIVVINKGSQDGLEPGHVLSVFQPGRLVQDPYNRSRRSAVRLPDEWAGTMMVFKTYNRISYGLIMKAVRSIHKFDKVTNPVNSP